jgi:hypothetical protein
MTDSPDMERDQRVRERAYRIWEDEGHPDGRADAHWEMARELVAIEENADTATKPVATAARGTRAAGGAEPVEPREALENQGEAPGLRDQGEESPRPPSRRRRTSPSAQRTS